VKAQVALPVADGHRRDHLVDLAVKCRHRERKLLRRRDLQRGKERGPRKVRRELVGGVERGRVVVQRDVAREILLRLRDARETRFEAEHRRRLRGGLLARHTRQLEHARNVLLVRLADRFLVGIEIVRLVRQPEAALLDVRKIHAGILEVGEDLDRDDRVFTLRGRRAQVLGDRGTVTQRIDRGEPRFQRLDSLRVDARFVHARDPEIGDDLLHAFGLGQARGVLGNLSLDVERPLPQDVRRAPGRLVGRDRVRGEPLVVDVARQVRAAFFVGSRSLALKRIGCVSLVSSSFHWLADDAASFATDCSVSTFFWLQPVAANTQTAATDETTDFCHSFTIMAPPGVPCGRKASGNCGVPRPPRAETRLRVAGPSGLPRARGSAILRRGRRCSPFGPRR
jgi:hypothetical protein